MPHAAGEYPVEGLVVAAKPNPHQIHARPMDNGVRIGRDAAAGRTYHPIARDLVELVDGHRTLREIGRLAAQRHNARLEDIQDTLLGYFRGQIDDLGAATPDVTKCTSCPLRATNA